MKKRKKLNINKLLKLINTNRISIVKNSVTIALPISAISVCLIMGMKTKEPIKSSESNDITTPITATTTIHIIYTKITQPVVTQTTTSTTSVDKEIEANAVSLCYTAEPIKEYRAWNMYGNSMPLVDEYCNVYDYKFVNSELLTYIYKECEKYDVPYEMALATCFVESNFTSDINNEGLNEDGSVDYGIMGLNGNYLMENCIAYNGGLPINKYDPYENVHIGIQILSDNLTYFGGSVWDAANAYNLGISGWEEMNRNYGYWYYGEKILNYMNVLYNMPKDNSTDHLNEDWSVD